MYTGRRRARDLVGEQLPAFHEELRRSLDFARARALHLTPYDVLIVASMVEREAQDSRRPRARSRR